MCQVRSRRRGQKASEAASAATGQAFRLLPKPYGIDSLSDALAETLADAAA